VENFVVDSENWFLKHNEVNKRNFMFANAFHLNFCMDLLRDSMIMPERKNVPLNEIFRDEERNHRMNKLLN
jgi:hypothetical protein